jgi:streptogramin lyase
MRLSVTALSCAVVACSVLAQDAEWVANRTSNTLSRILPWGYVAQTAPTATNLRRVVVAPDGKLWVVRFIQSQFDIYDATGALLTTVTNPTGSVYDIAFDKFGHAWVSGGSQAHEYDANGVLQPTTYALAAAAPLGISVDADGNKWIAHRVSPGVLSKIDATTGAVTSYPVAAAGMLPTVAFSDFRGFGVSSHVWVIGDSSGLVVEFDVNGVQLNSYPSTLSSIASFAQDFLSGDYFIGSFAALGPIARMTPAGVVSGLITNGAPCLGLNFDSFGRLLVTTRFTAPVLSEVRRYDIAGPTLEVISTVGTATQSAVSTRRDFALVVDPLADADGDGAANGPEILAGTSPWDPQSNASTSINTVGPTSSGSTFALNVVTGLASTTAIGAGPTITPGLSVAGLAGQFFLDQNTMLPDPVTNSPILVLLNGPAVLFVTVPPASAGLHLYIQGLTVDGSGGQFTNLTGLFVHL